MSDEFMSDVNSAIESAGADKSIDAIPTNDTSLVTPAATPAGEKDEKAALESSVLSLMGADDEKPAAKKEAPKEEPKAKQEAKPEPTPAKSTEQTEEDKQQTTAPKDGTDEKSLAMDQFLKEDENNNLVLNDGTVVAAAGKARQFFEKLKREARDQRQQAQQLAVSGLELSRQFQSLHGEYEKLKTQPKLDLATETGLQPADVDMTINLMKEYKRDPISAVKKLLTQMHTNGIDVSTLGVGTAIDPTTMKETLTSIVTDMLAKQSPQSKEIAGQPMTHEQAVQEATAFLTKYPEAKQHENAIANAKMKFPEMGLEEIWLRFQLHLSKNPQQQQQPPAAQTPAPVVEQTPQPKQNVAPVTKVVTPPKRDYGSMSFAEIAKSINEDFVQ